MPERPWRTIANSFPPPSPLMMPAQHRLMAVMLRRDFADDPETPELALAHEQIARAIELGEAAPT